MLDRNQNISLKKKVIFTTFIIIMIVCLVELGLWIEGYIILRLNQPSNVISKIKDKDEFVILCLGDSYTFGIGVDYQDSYPRHLENILDENPPKIRRFKVYNLGIPGSNSSQLANNLQCNIDKYNPDLLIVMTGRNDLWNFADINTFSLLDHLRLYKLVRIIGVNLKDKIQNKMTNIAIAKTNSTDHCKVKNKNIKRKNITPEADQQVVIGHNLFEQGRFNLAKKCFLKALQFDPNNVGANRHLGTIYREEAKYELAEKCLKEALAQNEEYEDLSAYLELGMVHQVQRKYKLAKGELKKAVLDSDLTYLALNELLLLYKNKEEFYKDIEDFRRGIKDKDILAKIDRLLRFQKDEEFIYTMMSRNLIKINKISKKNNVRILLQTYPTLDTITKNICKMAEEYHIPLVDNRLIFHKKDFFVGDGHCNTEGYRIIAQNTYRTLIKEGIIDDVIDKWSEN